MFWRVLKPNPGLADEPSVRERIRSYWDSVLPAVTLVVIFFLPATARSASPAANNNVPESPEIAAVEYLTSTLPLRELGSQTLKVSSSTVPGYTIRRIAMEVRLQFSIADEHGRLITNLSADD